jgi:hypothetical protein
MCLPSPRATSTARAQLSISCVFLVLLLLSAMPMLILLDPLLIALASLIFAHLWLPSATARCEYITQNFNAIHGSSAMQMQTQSSLRFISGAHHFLPFFFPGLCPSVVPKIVSKVVFGLYVLTRLER